MIFNSDFFSSLFSLQSKRTLVISALVLIVFAECSKRETTQGFKITGELTGFPDGTELYLTNLSTDANIDTAVVKNGEFRFEGFLDATPEQLRLAALVDKNFYYTVLLVGNEDITVKADIKDFPWDVKVVGSVTHDEYYDYRSLIKDNMLARDSSVRGYLSLNSTEQEEKGPAIWKEIGKLDSIRNQATLNYIRSNPGSYTSVINLGYLREELPKDTLVKIFNGLSPEIRQSRYAKVIDIFLKEPAVKVGERYRDFDAFNQENQHVKLSEIKGKYTLVDFTSANCGPCIEAANELREINIDFSDRVKIASFSIDANKKVWIKSLARDGVQWTSLWDGNGPFGETVIKYGVQGFPSFVLIGPDDIIIDKWVGYEKGMIRKKLEAKVVQ